MNAAEIVVSKVQRDSGFQVRQLLAERIVKPLKVAKLRSHGQILSLNKASRDVIFSACVLRRNQPKYLWV